MRKLLALFLALALMAGVLPALAEPAPALSDETAGLPAVGDVVEGFEVKEIRPFDMMKETVEIFYQNREKK